MARIESGAELHIKEGSIITIMTIEDAITDIIAILVLIFFCTPKLDEEKKKEAEVIVFCVSVVFI